MHACILIKCVRQIKREKAFCHQPLSVNTGKWEWDEYEKELENVP